MVVLGDAGRVDAFALAGATAVRAESTEAIRQAWTDLPAGVAVVVLTHDAAVTLGDAVIREDRVLSVVMPP